MIDGLLARIGGGFFQQAFVVADFDAAKHQDQSLLRYTRKTLPADLEYINNFVFLPEEKAASILARL